MKPKEELDEENVNLLYSNYNKAIEEEYKNFMKSCEYIVRILNMQKKIMNHKNDIWFPTLNMKTNDIKNKYLV